MPAQLRIQLAAALTDGVPPADKTAGEPAAEQSAGHAFIEPDIAAAISGTVMDFAAEQHSAWDCAMVTEVEILGRTVTQAKVEIAALTAPSAGPLVAPSASIGRIVTASGELDAVAAHAAAATESVLMACERLDRVADGLSAEAAAAVQAATTQIYEACSFQDITGQRIAKVVGTLKAVEAKVDEIVARFGRRAWEDASSSVPRTGLCGPQLPGAGLVQDDVDALFG